MFTLIILIASLASPFSGASIPPTRALSLAEALRLAEEHSPALLSAKKSARITELKTTAATGALLPSLDLSATQGVSSALSNAANAPNSPWSSQLSLNLTETLYDNGQSLAERRIALLNQESDSLRLTRARSQLALDLSKEFYRFSELQHLLQVKRDQAALIEKQFEQVSSLYRQGLKTYKDYLRLKTKLQSAKIAVIRNENDIRASRIELQKILGTDDLPDFVRLPNPAIESAPMPMIPKSMPDLARHPDLRVQELQVQVTTEHEELSRRRLWPEISASAAAVYSASDYLGPSPAPSGAFSWNALLKVQYNFWDWGIRKSARTQALCQREIQEAQLQKVAQSLRSELNTLMSQLEQSKDDYQLNKDLLKMSKESYAVVEQEYRTGKVSYVDLTESLDALLTSQTQFLSAHFSLLKNLAAYHFYEGTLYETLLAKP